MNLQERIKSVVTDKLDHSLSYIQAELDDIGFQGLDLNRVKADLLPFIDEMYNEKTVNEENALVILGTSEDTSPQSLARSLTCLFIKKWLNGLAEALNDLEENEDKKLEKWVRNKFGKDMSVDFQNLLIKDEKAYLIRYLKIIHQVLAYESNHLASIIKSIQKDAGGEAALIHDLSMARLTDARVEQVMNDLLNLEDPKIIDELIESPELKSIKNFKAVKFMATVQKKRLELGINDSEWKQPDDDAE